VVRALVALLLVGAFGISGCSTSCAPLLEVRHCVPGSERCAPDPGDTVRAWDAGWAAGWPEIDRWMRELPVGEHGHEDWTEARRTAWWAAAGTGDDAGRPEAFFTQGDALFRVRVLTC
jgi:hypothetical protein